MGVPPYVLIAPAIRFTCYAVNLPSFAPLVSLLSFTTSRSRGRDATEAASDVVTHLVLGGLLNVVLQHILERSKYCDAFKVGVDCDCKCFWNNIDIIVIVIVIVLGTPAFVIWNFE